MVDVVIAVIAIFYAGQTLDVVYRNHKELIKFAPIPILLVALLPTFFISRVLFAVNLFFLLIMWSKSNRSESWGIEYHTLLIFAIAIALGPWIGLFLTIIPFILVPKIRRDIAIIELLFSIFIYSVMALLLGAITSPTNITGAAIWASRFIIGHNIIKGLFLYGKVDMIKLNSHIIVNIGMNYYLMLNVLPSVVQWIGA